MNELTVAEMVGAMYWYRLPDGSMPITDETAVSMVAEYAEVTRPRACALLLDCGPTARARRQACVDDLADMVIAGVISRGAAMNAAQAETGRSLGWCAAALADAVCERRARHTRRDDGSWA